MIIKLPTDTTFYKGQGKIEIKDGILKISHLVSWREFMYKLTINTKGSRCYYCGKKLQEKEITMDHLYPQYLGGPTIPANLVPCCSLCNNRKGNLTELQYRQTLQAPEKKRKSIRNRLLKNNENHKMKKGYFLPREWITSKKIDTILVTFLIGESYAGKRYSKIENFYKEYGNLPYPIVVDRNNFLLDGFLVLIFAKNNNITKVPTIVLENVEIMLNK